MNAITGIAPTTMAAQLYALASVRPVKPIVPNAERNIAPETDTYEPSSEQAATPAVTYGRNGR
jgi:hypothetical protein